MLVIKGKNRTATPTRSRENVFKLTTTLALYTNIDLSMPEADAYEMLYKSGDSAL